MPSRVKKFLTGAFVFASFVAAVAVPLSHLRGSSDPAVSYLKSKPLSPWGIMALANAGERPLLDSLKTVAADKAINLEAPILALSAAGKDPRTFGGRDLVAKLKSFYDGAQLGDPATLNDDIFGLLALLSSGEAPNGQVASGIEKFILGKQNADGGFAFAAGAGSDTNTTAAAIMALRAAGLPASDAALAKAETYLKGAQNDDGGFPYDPKSQWGTASDASSDAFVIMAAKALGEDAAAWQKNGKSPVQSIESLKDPAGFYLYQSGAAEDSFTPVTTAYALLALSGKTLPVSVLAAPAPSAVSFSVRVEGKESELCQIEGEGRTGLDALFAAADSCGLPYHIQSSSLGEYVDEISGEKAAGASGWLYDVNSVPPSVGAADFKLSAGDAVVWYFGDYGSKEARLTLSTSTVSASSPVTGAVEYFDGGSWKPLSGAAVKSGDKRALTDETGAFSLALETGRRAVFAEKPGYVRTQSETVTVGSLDRAEVPLSVTIPAPAETEGTPAGSGTGSVGAAGSSGPQQSSISVMVESAGAGGTAAFGAVSRGGIAQKNVTLKNNGPAASVFSASVSGDALFRRYLKLNERGWRSFRATLSGSAATSTVASLFVPADYRESGVKTGALVFWATPAAQ